MTIKIMVLQTAQFTKFSSEFGIVSKIIIMFSGSVVVVLSGLLEWSSLNISG